MPNTVVIYDTEFTTWKGAMENDWGEDWQHRELVQIAAMRFDIDNFKLLESFDYLIQPVKNPELSDYFTGLTGITNDDLNARAVTFEQAMIDYKAFLNGDRSYSYGADDVVIRENAELYNSPDWLKEYHDLDIAPFFRQADEKTKTINSGALATYFKAIPEGETVQEHYALWDVKSIAFALTHLIKEGHKNPFT